MNCAIAGAIALKDTAFYDKWLPLFQAFESGAWLIWFTADTIFVAILPTVKRAAPQRLHCDDGPAFTWCDMELYYLNGVLVEPWMVMTPVDQIDPTKILAVTNVDQRTQLIRRVGIVRLFKKLPHQVLESRTIDFADGERIPYSLLAIDLSPQHKACRFLQMKNPSTGETHVEGVANECQTVQHAINWRAYKDINREWSPAYLS